MKKVFCALAAFALIAGVMVSCSGGADWRAKMTKMQQLVTEELQLMQKYLAGDTSVEKRANEIEKEINTLGEELDKIYATLSDAEKKEFDAKKAEIEGSLGKLE